MSKVVKRRTHVCFLRGINVGGKNRLKMANLKLAFEQYGLENVKTYIQSGNVLFHTREKADLGQKIVGLIKSEFKMEVGVLILGRAKLLEIIRKNPFDGDPKHWHATILGKAPRKSDIAQLASIDSGDDEYCVIKNVVYLRCPNGSAKTKLTNNLFEKKLGTTATTRNWRTMNKVLELFDQA